jgi:hypothetical protein
MRFNVAFSTEPAMWELLEKVLVKHVRRGGVNGGGVAGVFATNLQERPDRAAPA